MPLVRTLYSAVDAMDEFSFPMLDGEKIVRVDVHRRLLEDIDTSLRRTPAGYMAALEAHRPRIEQIASAKYDEGDFLSYANSSVVPIRKSDWARHTAA